MPASWASQIGVWSAVTALYATRSLSGARAGVALAPGAAAGGALATPDVGAVAPAGAVAGAELLQAVALTNRARSVTYHQVRMRASRDVSALNGMRWAWRTHLGG